MVMRQYPYQLLVWRETDGTFDESGFWIPGSSEYIFHSVCRDEANSAGVTIRNPDGTHSVFDVLIQTPLGTEPLSPGTKIQVVDRAEVRFEGYVKRSRREQFHTRIWA